MLTQIRKKILQKDIKQYSELRIASWYNRDVVSYLHQYPYSGKQRYSREKMKKSFENLSLHSIPYYKVNNEIYNMILCPSGSLEKEHEDEDDNLPETMTIPKAFLLGETEITQELYYAVMNKKPSKFQDEYDPYWNTKNPVENVSWYDAVMFCNKLSDIFGLARYYTLGNAQEIKNVMGEEETHYLVEINENAKGFRLPTEWEWEYAAKAENPFLYSGSNDPNAVAWYKSNSRGTTNPVKQLNPNAWGFYDMSGNVNEWCENKDNIVGKDDASVKASRAFRGGCWMYDSNLLPTAFRNGTNPSFRKTWSGFRICRYI